MIFFSIVAGLVFVAVQLPNKLLRRFRMGGTVVALIFAVLSVAFGPHRDVAAVILFFALIALSNKWYAEVSDDISSRELEDRPRLVKRPMNVIWNPATTLRYRNAMFRDSWSRERLIQLSDDLPWGLDGRRRN